MAAECALVAQTSQSYREDFATHLKRIQSSALEATGAFHDVSSADLIINMSEERKKGEAGEYSQEFSITWPNVVFLFPKD